MAAVAPEVVIVQREGGRGVPPDLLPRIEIVRDGLRRALGIAAVAPIGAADLAARRAAADAALAAHAIDPTLASTSHMDEIVFTLEAMEALPAAKQQAFFNILARLCDNICRVYATTRWQFRLTTAGKDNTLVHLFIDPVPRGAYDRVVCVPVCKRISGPIGFDFVANIPGLLDAIWFGAELDGMAQEVVWARVEESMAAMGATFAPVVSIERSDPFMTPAAALMPRLTALRERLEVAITAARAVSVRMPATAAGAGAGVGDPDAAAFTEPLWAQFILEKVEGAPLDSQARFFARIARLCDNMRRVYPHVGWQVCITAQGGAGTNIADLIVFANVANWVDRCDPKAVCRMVDEHGPCPFSVVRCGAERLDAVWFGPELAGVPCTAAW